MAGGAYHARMDGTFAPTEKGAINIDPGSVSWSLESKGISACGEFHGSGSRPGFTNLVCQENALLLQHQALHCIQETPPMLVPDNFVLAHNLLRQVNCIATKRCRSFAKLAHILNACHSSGDARLLDENDDYHPLVYHSRSGLFPGGVVRVHPATRVRISVLLPGQRCSVFEQPLSH